MTPAEVVLMTAAAVKSHKKDFKGLSDAEVAEAGEVANAMYANNEDTTMFLLVFEDVSRAFVALDRVQSSDVERPFAMAPDTVSYVAALKADMDNARPALERVRRRAMIMKAAHRILVCATVDLRRVRQTQNA